MTNVKVKVSKEVAEAIEALRKCDKSNEEILQVIADPNNSWAGPKSKVLNTTSFDTVAKALYLGYEIEQTPAEKVAEYYKEYQQLLKNGSKYPEQHSRYRGVMDAVEFVAKAYGLKIEGVSA